MDAAFSAALHSSHASTPLHGRSRELAMAQRVLDRIQAGDMSSPGAVVLLGGASGVGKTALASAILEMAAERGFEVRRAACEPFHEGMSFFPIRELIRQFGGGRPISMLISEMYGADSVQVDMAGVSDSVTADPASRREALVATFTNVLFGRMQTVKARPIILFLDDLEHLDVGSADAMICLISRIHEGPVVVLGAYRSDLVSASSHALKKVISTARRTESVLTHLDLDGFDESNIDELVEIMLGGPTNLPSAFYEKLNRETEGNPLFIREVLRSLQAQQPDGTRGNLRKVDGVWRFEGPIELWAIPPTVEDVIATRLNQLDAEQREELEFAAVIGRRFAFEVFLGLMSKGEDALLQRLEQYLSFDIIREIESSRDDTFEFSHGKIRDVLYEALSGLRRRRMHGAVAEVLQASVGTTNEDWDALVGEHLFKAAKHAEAFPYLLRAARNARSTGSEREAASLFRKALEASDGAVLEGDDSRQSIQLELASALVLASETDEAASILELLIAEHVPTSIRGHALNHLGDALLFEGHVEQALERYGKCEDIAETLGDMELLCEVSCDLAELHGRLYERLAGVDPTRAEAERRQYVAYVERAYELRGTKHRGGALTARVLRNKAKLSRTSGDLRTAEALYKQAIDSVDKRVSGHRFLIPYSKTLRLAGKGDLALEYVERIRAWSTQVGSVRSEAIAWQYRATILATKSSDEGTLREARAAADRAMRLHHRIGYAQGVHETFIVMGEIALRGGATSEAVAHFRQVLPEGADSRAPGDLFESVARELDANGEIDRAAYIRAYDSSAAS